MAISDSVQARIDRAVALIGEFDAEIGRWFQRKEVATMSQEYIDGLHDVPPLKRKPFSAVPPLALKDILRRIADELAFAIDDRLALGNLKTGNVAALKAFQTGDGGYFAPFLKVIADPDGYVLKALIVERWVLDSIKVRDAKRQASEPPMSADPEFTLEIATQPGNFATSCLYPLIAELRNLLDAPES